MNRNKNMLFIVILLMFVDTSVLANISVKEDSTCIYGVPTTSISVEIADSSFTNLLDNFLNQTDSIESFNNMSYMHYIVVENDSVIQIGIIAKQGMSYYVKAAQCNRYCLNYKNTIFHLNDTINNVVLPISPISSCVKQNGDENNIDVSNGITHIFHKYKYSNCEYKLIESKEL